MPPVTKTPTASNRYTSGHTTLIDLLVARAEAQGESLLYRYLESGDIGGPTTLCSFGDLDRRARAIGARLQEAGAAGERVLLLYPPGIDFCAGFFGCLYAGAVAVPTYPPEPQRLERTLPRFRAIAKDAGARFVLTLKPILALLGGMVQQAPELAALSWVASDDLPIELGERWQRPQVDGDALAFLQYTSGSTGRPKGVMVRHANVLHNSMLIAMLSEPDEETTWAGWVPLFHDMGLLTLVVQPVYAGISCTLLSPIAFLQRPMRWLEAISHFRATMSGGPNFAFELCARKATPSAVAALDLRSWAAAYNGAEPIRSETIERFTETFAAAGFRREAMLPTFGLAESTLVAACARLGSVPVQRPFDPAALAQGRATLVPKTDGAHVLVSSGRIDLGLRVEIVDPATRRRCPQGKLGEIWLSGGSIAAGYWNRPEETAEAFAAVLADTGEGSFLRTGDLGFILDGDLFVAGRIKDLLIINGRNHYPQDIELTVEHAHPAVRPGCCAAFPVEAGGVEQLGVAFEVDLPGDANPDVVIELVTQELLDAHGVYPYLVALLPPRSIHKTSSGKIQRRITRDALQSGKLEVLAQRTASQPAAAPPPPAGPGELRDVTEEVERQVRAVLGIDGSVPLDLRRSFPEFGMDSLMSLQLRNRLSAALGQKLPRDLVYSAPSVASLGSALRELLAKPSDGSSSGAVAGEKESLHAALASAPDLQARISLLTPHLEHQLLRTLGRDQLDPDLRLAEAGIDDVLGGELCLRMGRELGLRVFPRELLGSGTFREFTRFVAESYAPYVPPKEPLELTELDRRIKSPYDVSPLRGLGAPSNQPMLFVLSPPRSGSTLLRVMLAGHSRLFAPQELYLGCFANMRSYDRHLGGTALNMGLVAAIAEVLSRTGAWNLYNQWQKEAVATSEIYSFFGSRIGDRTLVDKSPLFFPPQAVIRRLALLFPRARFIHLVRHPVACIGSYARERFHGIFGETRDLDPYDCAEWSWTRVQEGILEIEAELEPGRMQRLYFEDLATNPEQALRRLCPSLGLSFEPALLTPYSGHRMVAGGFQVGDPNFVHHKKIEVEKADAWRDERLPHGLRPQTLAVAERLGYDTSTMPQSRPRVIPPSPAGAAPRDAEPRPATGDTAMGGIDLERDASLTLPALSGWSAASGSGPPRSIFLTGASGFLGAFLVSTLLERTTATVYCLVRATDAAHGLQRLRGNLERYGLWRDSSASRIRPVPGDLCAPRLGMSEAEYASLGRELDVVLHGASQISWLKPYRQLFDTNVEGTRRLLEFASAGRPKAVHYVSSLGATLIRPFENTRMVEAVTAASGLGTESILEMPLGYLETKWVAHRMVKQARRQGLPVTLYGPGLISGHSQTGIDSLSDSQFLHALIKGSTQLQCFPDGTGWRFIPVDAVARSIVDCMLHPESTNCDIYLDSTTLLPPELMIKTLRGFGFDVHLAPYAAWRQKVLDLAAKNDIHNALYGFTDVIYTMTPLRFLGQRYQLQWYLENGGAPQAIRTLLEPREHIQASLLHNLVDYYVRAGAMPEPTLPTSRPRPLQAVSVTS